MSHLNNQLQHVDPEMLEAIELETKRQHAKSN